MEGVDITPPDTNQSNSIVLHGNFSSSSNNSGKRWVFYHIPDKIISDDEQALSN